MKKLLPLLLLFFFCVSTLKSQKDCSANFRVAQNYLEKRKDIHGGFLNEIEKSLDSCLAEDANSYYLKGLVELRKNDSNSKKRSYGYFKRAAEQNHTRAKTYLGYFYKNGWGDVSIDLEKSLFWIKQAAEDGDPNSLYTLGYYYMKGLAELEVDYDKAIHYFELSNHKMAKHWLALCKHIGLGTIPEKAEAKHMLDANGIPESEDLLTFLGSSENPLTSGLKNFQSFQEPVPSNLSDNTIQPIMQGIWMEKDWKNEKVIRELPLTLILNRSNQDKTSITITIENRKYQAVLNKSGKLETNNLKLRLPSPFSADDSFLNYHIKEVFFLKDKKTGFYDIELSVFIEEYKEKGPPINIRIYSQEAVNKKIESSFFVYPNSFVQSLNFTFEIEHQSNVSLSIYDLNGNNVQEVDYNVLQQGKQNIEFNGTNLKPKNYFAVLTVNGFKFIRQVIKTN